MADPTPQPLPSAWPCGEHAAHIAHTAKMSETEKALVGPCPECPPEPTAAAPEGAEGKQ